MKELLLLAAAEDVEVIVGLAIGEELDVVTTVRGAGIVTRVLDCSVEKEVGDFGIIRVEGEGTGGTPAMAGITVDVASEFSLDDLLVTADTCCG